MGISVASSKAISIIAVRLADRAKGGGWYRHIAYQSVILSGLESCLGKPVVGLGLIDGLG